MPATLTRPERITIQFWRVARSNPRLAKRLKIPEPSQSPALLRFTKSDATLRSGARIAKGQNVVALTLSAMFDPDAFSEPGCFRADRDPHQYLHFGSGLHTCYGRMINQVQIPALVSRVLMLPGLRRADGRAGRTAFEGPFPDRLVVAFGAQR